MAPAAPCVHACTHHHVFRDGKGPRFPVGNLVDEIGTNLVSTEIIKIGENNSKEKKKIVHIPQFPA